MAETEAQILDRVIPFNFLTGEEQGALARDLTRRKFEDGAYLVRGGDQSGEVFLISEGCVEVVDERQEPPAILSLIEAGHYFGERAPLFDTGRQVSVRARGEVVVFGLEEARFLALVADHPRFAQALGDILRVKQGIFRGYSKLFALVLSLIAKREFLLSELIPSYVQLSPALHPLVHSDRIDTGALAYAAARLPGDVSQTTFYFLTTVLPPLYEEAVAHLDPVPTRARRRSAWKALPGKTIIQIRDGISDVADFVTCLSAYMVEARKIRHRHRHSKLLTALEDLPDVVPPDRDRELSSRAHLDADELAALRAIWGGSIWHRLRDVLLHHEDVAIECDLQPDNYNSSAAEDWVTKIRARAAELVDIDDPSLRVHVISSNTHSVRNCLSPYLAEHGQTILAWGRERLPELEAGTKWNNSSDLIYQYARFYFEAHAEEAEAAAEAERAAGRVRIDSTAYTGIDVDLFCVSALDFDHVDPGVKARAPEQPTLVVNIDYAFGQQAEQLLASLISLFGHRIESVSVMGKAGGLGGKRGDLLLPRATLLQTNDELYALPNCDLSAEELRTLSGDRTVHEGPVLTVAGTLLQDRTLLNFYRRIWRCVGLEMEGSFFARQLQSSIMTGVLDPGVKARFAYYVSDLPLDSEENLAEAMAPGEGTPPLYAITRAILNHIFGG